MRFGIYFNRKLCLKQWCSGAGTHGNGVPTREILRDNFLLAIFHYRHVMTFSAPETISKLDIRICKVLAH